MELKNKLKELRLSRGMTQEKAAEHLGVSSQTVSKWERGLLSPDIALLPKIALLFKCSIDYLFDMESVWGIEHRREFEAEIKSLQKKNDWEGVYRAWMREIKLNPDCYSNYPEVMLYVLRRKLFDNEYIEKMISLAEHAEKCCADDDIRNEIYRIMLQICSQSEDRKIKEKGQYYCNKLPLLKHSREVYAKYVMENDEYYSQVQKNIIYLIDLAECSVRQLITTDMPLEEKLFYYQKAANLYEVVLDDKYAGFYDPPLLTNYTEIAKLYVQLGKMDMAEKYINRILTALEKHISQSECKSKLLHATTQPNAVPTEQLCKKLLQNMLSAPELNRFSASIENMQRKYNESL